MKIKRRIPELNESLHKELIDSGWIPLKEYDSLAVAILMSLPFMAANLFLSLMVIMTFSTISLEEFGFTPESFSITISPATILAILILVLIHEFLHLIFIPNFMRSSKTYVGLTKFGAFVATEEEITRSRYILISIGPFLIVSIILPILLSPFGLLTSTIKAVVLLNAMASSVDMLNLFLVTTQVPSNAVLINNGPKTYWKSPPERI